MAPPPSPGGGNILTRKFGPLPAWAWAGLAVGGYLIYKQRKAASAASASSTPITSTAATAPIAQAPSGYGYQGPGGGGFFNPGPIPTGAMGATNTGGPQYFALNSTNSGPYLNTPGNTEYYQPAPGTFLPIPNWASVAPGTQVYGQVPSGSSGSVVGS